MYKKISSQSTPSLKYSVKNEVYNYESSYATCDLVMCDVQDCI